MASNSLNRSLGPMTTAELGMSHYNNEIPNNSHRNMVHNTFNNSREGPGLTINNLAESSIRKSSQLNATKYASRLPISNIDKAINILELFNSRGYTKSKNAQISELQSAIVEIQREIDEIQKSHGGNRSRTHKRSSIRKKTRRHKRRHALSRK